jgi:hypothetical protein
MAAEVEKGLILHKQNRCSSTRGGPVNVAAMGFGQRLERHVLAVQQAVGGLEIGHAGHLLWQALVAACRHAGTNFNRPPGAPLVAQTALRPLLLRPASRLIHGSLPKLLSTEFREIQNRATRLLNKLSPGRRDVGKAQPFRERM